MRALSGVDLSYLTKQIKESTGARIEKIYEQKDSFFFVVKKSGEKKKILAIFLPSAIFFSSSKPEMGAPSAFCAKLRTLIERAIITEVKQIELERILQITLNTKEGIKTLIIELFSKGNLIVCDQDLKIILPKRSQTWKDRILKRGQTYHLPPSRMTPLNTKKSEWIKEVVNTEKKTISGYLATVAGLGGHFAELICKECNIDAKAKEVTKKQAEQLFDAFNALLKEVPKEDLSKKYEEHWLTQIKETKKENKQVKKIKSIIATQEQSIVSLQEDIEKNKQKADAIFAHYQEISDLLKKAKQTKHLKELADNPLVKKVDPKKKTITLQLP